MDVPTYASYSSMRLLFVLTHFYQVPYEIYSDAFIYSHNVLCNIDLWTNPIAARVINFISVPSNKALKISSLFHSLNVSTTLLFCSFKLKFALCKNKYELMKYIATSYVSFVCSRPSNNYLKFIESEAVS
jgi:hypothetical protein